MKRLRRVSPWALQQLELKAEQLRQEGLNVTIANLSRRTNLSEATVRKGCLILERKGVFGHIPSHDETDERFRREVIKQSDPPADIQEQIEAAKEREKASSLAKYRQVGAPSPSSHPYYRTVHRAPQMVQWYWD